MARRKNRRRARRNPATITVRRNRRHTTVRARSRRHHARRNTRRRNPVLFGHAMSPTGLVKTTLGVLVGVTIAKLVPPMIPGTFATSSPAMRVIVTGVTAFLAGMAGNKLSPDIGSAVLLGGLAQTVSQALNAFIPSVGAQIGLQGVRGMGMLVPGGFPMPQNPVNAAALAPAPSMIPMKGGGVGGWGQGRGIMAA